ncbi:hypothetical protein [Sulfobacillus thermosulfidooxidans]|uniref:hypothetical protein n=1 Tax=Sulfobacillus thermosulfidooxidans TaxID=28034 RepID=UPI0006B435C2|nr:hypothetical protein [Sulfobacillus thermosulfidooxidans]
MYAPKGIPAITHAWEPLAATPTGFFMGQLFGSTPDGVKIRSTRLLSAPCGLGYKTPLATQTHGPFTRTTPG